MTADVDMKGSLSCCFGLPNHGKTNFVKWLFHDTERCVVIDTLHEYDPDQFHVVRPENRRYPAVSEEANQYLGALLEGENPAYVVVEEANRVMPQGKDPGEYVPELIDFNTHYRPEVGVMAVCRRPTQLNVDFKELADYWFIFDPGRVNDRDYYKSVNPEIVELLDQKEPYQFVVADSHRNATLCEAVPEMDSGDRGI